MYKTARNVLKKARKLFLWIPVLSLICGLTISYYTYRKMFDREIADQRSESAKRSKEIIQALDLQLSNSILRIQSYEEYIGSRPRDYKRDTALLGQSLRYTVFQRFSIFQQVGPKGSSPPRMKLLSRVNTSNSTVPNIKGTFMSSEAVLNAIEQIIRHKEFSRAVLHEREGIPLITYVLQSRNKEHIFFLFTAPLISIFDKTDLRSSETIEIEDSETNFSWVVSSDGNNKKIRPSSAQTESQKNETLLQTLKLGEPQSNALRVHFHFNFQQPRDRLTPALITGLLSVLISFIISYLFWILVTQNRMVSRLVIDKTHDLEKAHQELQEALIAKTRFLGNISHEIRTPLNLILGMVDLCEEKDTDKKIKEYLQSMRSSGNHLLSMIEDLLDLAKSETNELQVQPKSMNFPAFLSDIAKISGNDCAKKNLRLYPQFAFDLPTVIKYDPSRLRQILLNLLRNACKYTNQGHVILRVFVVEKTGTNTATIRFEVEDTGIGIQDDKLQKIFEAFFQVENSAVFSEGGVGLGLAIVKELVRKLNGRLKVQSTPKKGSIFQVDLDMEVLDAENWIESYKAYDDTIKDFVLITSDQLLTDSAQALSMHPSVIFTQIDSIHDLLTHPASGASPNKWFLIDASKNNISAVDIDRLRHLGHIILLGKKESILTRHPGLPDPVLDYSPLLVADVLTTTGFNTKQVRRNENRTKTAAQNDNEIAIPDNLSILVADDDMGNQELYKAYFEGKPWKIEYTLNGKEALDQYLQSPADIIILDVRMPLMDGFEAANKIRQHESEQNLPPRPILLVTADALEETMHKAEAIANVRFLTKPIRKSTLMNSVTEMLK